MRTWKLWCVALCVVLCAGPARGQDGRRDRGVFVEPKNEFMDTLEAASKRLTPAPRPPRKELRLDFSAVRPPREVHDFTTAWHLPPVSQGISGMCWCFCATSFFESEIYRIHKRQIKLSELYTVYWEYVEKARRFVRERGDSEFGEGSQGNAVLRIWRQYGAVPAEAYTGLLFGRRYHDHAALFAEMKNYLQGVKTAGEWNEDLVLSTIRAILNHHLGEPPTRVSFEGRTMTPREYLENVVRLPLDDYADVLSILEQPYYQWVEYEVPDNWWHSRDYLNVPLDDYMAIIRKAIRAGYTIAIGGDTSEPGLEGHAGVAVVPTFDIPAAYIDEYARNFRFRNGTTGDDHGIHLVGYAQKEGDDWFLIKDSGSGVRNNNHPGYYFYHADYVKLKMLSFMVHRDMLGEMMRKVPARP